MNIGYQGNDDRCGIWLRRGVRESRGGPRSGPGVDRERLYGCCPTSRPSGLCKGMRPVCCGAEEIRAEHQGRGCHGESNPQLQQSQVDAAITGGAKAIVLIAADPSLASGSLNAPKRRASP